MQTNDTTQTADSTTRGHAQRWQNAMDAAYEKFTDGKSYDDFIGSLSADEKTVVLLGNLTGQVNNGGFSQWVDNGYATRGHDVVCELSVLMRYATPSELSVLREWKTKITAMLQFVKTGTKNRGFCGDYWVENDSDDCSDGPGRDLCDSMDESFYDSAEPVIRSTMEKFLASME